MEKKNWTKADMYWIVSVFPFLWDHLDFLQRIWLKIWLQSLQVWEGFWVFWISDLEWHHLHALKKHTQVLEKIICVLHFTFLLTGSPKKEVNLPWTEVFRDFLSFSMDWRTRSSLKFFSLTKNSTNPSSSGSFHLSLQKRKNNFNWNNTHIISFSLLLTMSSLKPGDWRRVFAQRHNQSFQAQQIWTCPGASKWSRCFHICGSSPKLGQDQSLEWNHNSRIPTRYTDPQTNESSD